MDDTTNTSNGAPSAPTEQSSTGPAVPGRRYRPRCTAVRDQRLTPRFTDAELSEIKAAADAAQMTLTGFCALRGLVLRQSPSSNCPVERIFPVMKPWPW